jgi:hypothetical protein
MNGNKRSKIALRSGTLARYRLPNCWKKLLFGGRTELVFAEGLIEDILATCDYLEYLRRTQALHAQISPRSSTKSQKKGEKHPRLMVEQQLYRKDFQRTAFSILSGLLLDHRRERRFSILIRYDHAPQAACLSAHATR